MTEKRSLSIRGHRTSISLEDAFWVELRAIAARRHTSLAALIAEIDADGPRTPTSPRRSASACWRTRCPARRPTSDRRPIAVPANLLRRSAPQAIDRPDAGPAENLTQRVRPRSLACHLSLSPAVSRARLRRRTRGLPSGAGRPPPSGRTSGRPGHAAGFQKPPALAAIPVSTAPFLSGVTVALFTAGPGSSCEAINGTKRRAAFCRHENPSSM